MEISQAPLPLPVESQMQRRYRKQLTVIKARQTEDTKMLQHVFAHEIFRRTKDLLGFIVRDQKLVRSIAAFSNLSVDVTNEIYSQSYTTQPTQRTLIEFTRFLYSIQRILTQEENYALSQYIESRINDNSASVPRPVSEATNEELEQCFSSLMVNYKQASLTAIKEAIQGIIPSKQDIESTARVIEKELARKNINCKFPAFSEHHYQQELSAIINREDFPKDAITQLDFSHEPIKVVPNIVGEFKYIKLLDFRGCTSLTTLPNLRSKQELSWLSFKGCTSLTFSPDLSGNTKLWYLSFNGCTSLQTPPDLRNNKKLSSLFFRGCTSLIAPPDLRNNQALIRLEFDNCTSLIASPDLSHSPTLRTLSFNGCTNLETPPDLSGNRALTWLSFNGCTNLETSPDLSGNRALTWLSFNGCTSLIAPPDLSGNKKLWYLSFNGCTSLQTPPDLRNNQALTLLSFTGCIALAMPPDLSTLTQLSALRVRGVFPENPELNIDVFQNLEAAQALIRAIEIYRFASQVINLDEEELSGFVSSSDEDSDEAQVQFSALPEVEEPQERKSRCRLNSGCHIL